MAQLGKYDLMEDKYNGYISNGMSEHEAWLETLNNWELYEYQNTVDSPQDAKLLNTRGKNIQFIGRKTADLSLAYAKKMAIILG